MDYANHYGYSDITPYEIIRRVSATTIEIREMKATRIDSNVNNGDLIWDLLPNEQRYSYAANTAAPIIRMRLWQGSQWHSIYGRHIISDAPKKFYDFNF